MKRFDVMYNDFVLIGPKSDPAGIKGKDIETALKTIQAKAAPFISRGDRSGTNSAELALWKQAGIDIATAKGPWYREIGQGMGAALNTAAAMNAYVLSDRGTWISFKNHGDLRDRGRRRQAAVQPVRRHAGEPGQVSEREEGARPGLRRLADLAGRAERRSPTTRSTASSCSSPTRRKRGLECNVVPANAETPARARRCAHRGAASSRLDELAETSQQQKAIVVGSGVRRDDAEICNQGCQRDDAWSTISR